MCVDYGYWTASWRNNEVVPSFPVNTGVSGNEIRKRGIKTENTAPERRGSKFHYLKLSSLFLGWGFSSALAYFTQFTKIYSICTSIKLTFYKGSIIYLMMCRHFVLYHFVSSSDFANIRASTWTNQLLNCAFHCFSHFSDLPTIKERI